MENFSFQILNLNPVDEIEAGIGLFWNKVLYKNLLLSFAPPHVDS
ncbi:hypothetical protein [Argonema galeatum]|nr:hypothetical protein [Argonema galeatum]